MEPSQEKESAQKHGSKLSEIAELLDDPDAEKRQCIHKTKRAPAAPKIAADPELQHGHEERRSHRRQKANKQRRQNLEMPLADDGKGKAS